MDKVEAATHEQVIEVAKDILQRGVNQGELSPANPAHQVMVMGAMFAVALTIANRDPDEVLESIVREAMEQHLRECPDHGSHSDQEPPGYL